jgi:hypothetical protein
MHVQVCMYVPTTWNRMRDAHTRAPDIVALTYQKPCGRAKTRLGGKKGGRENTRKRDIELASDALLPSVVAFCWRNLTVSPNAGETVVGYGHLPSLGRYHENGLDAGAVL